MSLVMHRFTIQDLEYLRHGDRSLMLRLIRPVGEGRFPIIVDLHGGAWNEGSLSDCRVRGEVLASAGYATVALDFRQGDDEYPSSLQDIHYAIRWLKLYSAQLGLDGSRLGLCGQSSGGHLAALIAMRPEDRRYSMIALKGGEGINAESLCVALIWPVINPLSRYRHLLRALKTAEKNEWVGRLPEFHEIYWRNEDAMAEGNPMMALLRGENIETPPAVWLQGTPDIVHEYLDPESGQTNKEPERFCNLYRKAGGEIDLIRVDYFEREKAAAMKKLVPFFSRHFDD